MDQAKDDFLNRRILAEPVFDFFPETTHVREGAVADDDEEEGVLLVFAVRWCRDRGRVVDKIEDAESFCAGLAAGCNSCPQFFQDNFSNPNEFGLLVAREVCERSRQNIRRDLVINLTEYILVADEVKPVGVDLEAPGKAGAIFLLPGTMPYASPELLIPVRFEIQAL